MMENTIEIVPLRSVEASPCQVLLMDDPEKFNQSKEKDSTNILVLKEKKEDENEKQQLNFGNETQSDNNFAIVSKPRKCRCEDEENQETKDFLANSKNEEHNSNIISVNEVRRSFKRKYQAISFVVVFILVVGIGIYLWLRPKCLPVNYEKNTIMNKSTSTTEKQLIELTTVDPNTIETRVNESFFSYNFL